MESVKTSRFSTTQCKRRRRLREDDIPRLFPNSPLAAPVRTRTSPQKQLKHQHHHQKEHEYNTRIESASSPLSPRVYHLEPLSRPKTVLPSTSFPSSDPTLKQSVTTKTRLESKSKTLQKIDCVAKIQCQIGGLQWQVDAILDEVLPEQQALMKAKRLALFHPVSPPPPQSFTESPAVVDYYPSIIMRSPELKKSKRNQRVSHRAQSRFGIESRQDTERSGLSLYEDDTELKDHALALWEHKYQANELNIRDSFYLLIHGNIMDILEHAALKRAWCHSMAEVNAESKRILYNFDTLLQLQITLSEILKVNVKKKTMYQLLHQNLWQIIDQKYFGVVHLPPPLHTEAQKDKNNKKTMSTTDVWIREHCLDEIFLHRNKLQSLQVQKQFACEKLAQVFFKHIHQMYTRHFTQWKKSLFYFKTCQEVNSFCKLKSTLCVYKMFRLLFQKKIVSCFNKWIFLLKEQRLFEQEAAAISIQSVWKKKSSRMKQIQRQLDLNASKLEALWVGFKTRRQLRRQKRYQRVLFATIQIQIQWRFLVRHRFFVHQFQLNRASKKITKAIRHYAEKRRLFKQAMARLTKLHAVVSIQMWIRRVFISKRCHERLYIRQIKAQRILRRFCHRIQLLKLFEERFFMILETKTEAAIKIQTLYRIRKAKERFNLLKDQLESQKRQEMIRQLWQNSYGTRIQTWWKKKKKKKEGNRNR